MEEKNDETKRLISRIKNAISLHESYHHEIRYRDAKGYANELHQIREDIMLLSNNFPDEAKKLMHDLIDIQGNIFCRADDSNGYIVGFFKQCVEDLGKIFSKLSVDIDEIVEVVYDLYDDNYGTAEDVISNFKEALREEGLDLLKEKFKESVSSKNLKDAEQKGNCNNRIEWKNKCHMDTVKRGLEEIADHKNDVDEYIQACSFATELHQHDHLDIARRLASHGRYDEALEWLNKMDHPIPSSWREDYSRLKINALLHFEKYEEAQQERIEWFNCCLRYDLYEEILKCADGEFKNKFREQTIESAFVFSDIYMAMNFLLKLGEINKCAQLVFLKEKSIDGRYDYTFRPFAKAFRETTPLAATILYRKLLENALDEGASRNYEEAARYLVSCCELSSQITDFGSYKKHEEYFKEIQEKHQRKRAFWGIFNPLIGRKLK